VFQNVLYHVALYNLDQQYPGFAAALAAQQTLYRLRHMGLA
jgi:hypothetical protein